MLSKYILSNGLDGCASPDEPHETKKKKKQKKRRERETKKKKKKEGKIV